MLKVLSNTPPLPGCQVKDVDPNVVVNVNVVPNKLRHIVALPDLSLILFHKPIY